MGCLAASLHFPVNVYQQPRLFSQMKGSCALGLIIGSSSEGGGAAKTSGGAGSRFLNFFLPIPLTGPPLKLKIQPATQAKEVKTVFIFQKLNGRSGEGNVTLHGHGLNALVTQSCETICVSPAVLTFFALKYF